MTSEFILGGHTRLKLLAIWLYGDVWHIAGNTETVLSRYVRAKMINLKVICRELIIRVMSWFTFTQGGSKKHKRFKARKLKNICLLRGRSKDSFYL